MGRQSVECIGLRIGITKKKTDLAIGERYYCK